MLTRRGFFTRAAPALVVAPAIVRVAGNLMPVSTAALVEARTYSISDLVGATLRNQTARLADNVTRNNALLQKLRLDTQVVQWIDMQRRGEPWLLAEAERRYA